jgi:hypothetical protein
LQIKVIPVGLENLVLVDEETQEKTFKVGSQGGGGVDSSGRKWRCGELEWEALMRTLDNAVSLFFFLLICCCSNSFAS